MASIEEVLKHDPVATLLDIWIRWQHRSELRTGWNERTPILRSEGALDSQQLYDRLDAQVAEAVDAIIEYDLPHVAGCAIKYRCHIMSVWPFKTMVYADVLVGAEVDLEKRLRRNNLTSNYFHMY